MNVSCRPGRRGDVITKQEVARPRLVRFPGRRVPACLHSAAGASARRCDGLPDPSPPVGGPTAGVSGFCGCARSGVRECPSPALNVIRCGLPQLACRRRVWRLQRQRLLQVPVHASSVARAWADGDWLYLWHGVFPFRDIPQGETLLARCFTVYFPTS